MGHGAINKSSATTAGQPFKSPVPAGTAATPKSPHHLNKTVEDQFSSVIRRFGDQNQVDVTPLLDSILNLLKAPTASVSQSSAPVTRRLQSSAIPEAPLKSAASQLAESLSAEDQRKARLAHLQDARRRAQRAIDTLRQLPFPGDEVRNASSTSSAQVARSSTSASAEPVMIASSSFSEDGFEMVESAAARRAALKKEASDAAATIRAAVQ